MHDDRYLGQKCVSLHRDLLQEDVSVHRCLMQKDFVTGKKCKKIFMSVHVGIIQNMLVSICERC